MTDALDSLTGLIPTVVAAGVVTKVTQSLFPGQQQPVSSKRVPKRSKKSKKGNHPGNFSNIGF